MYPLKFLRVAEARAQFGELLDAAEQGDPVFVERRGVRFRISVEPAAPRERAHAPVFEHVDPAILDGQWTWTQTARGLRLRTRRRG